MDLFNVSATFGFAYRKSVREFISVKMPASLQHFCGRIELAMLALHDEEEEREGEEDIGSYLFNCDLEIMKSDLEIFRPSIRQHFGFRKHSDLKIKIVDHVFAMQSGEEEGNRLIIKDLYNYLRRMLKIYDRDSDFSIPKSGF